MGLLLGERRASMNRNVPPAANQGNGSTRTRPSLGRKRTRARQRQQSRDVFMR